MASVITIAGEQLFAAKAQANEQLDIDTFIFANVPNQDPSAPINREEGIPTAHIVYQQNVQQVGRVNDNVVVYSTVLDSITGPFEFNWVGLYSSVNQKLVAINHVPTVTKTVTAPGEAGNTLNRNFGIEYSGIAALTNITVDAETWQLNFTARLSGMDLLTQQLAADMNGKDWFIDDGLKVVPRTTANTFSVTPGVGYVSGLRVELKQEHILIVQSYPQFVYVDAWFSGNANSTWSPQLAFTVTNTEMDDYIDPSGTQHYVYKLAVVNAADSVVDLRNTDGLSVKVNRALDTSFIAFETVKDMVNGNAIGSHIINFEDIALKKSKVITKWNNSITKRGGKTYEIITNQQAIDRGINVDGTDEPDYNGRNHYLNDNRYVAVIVENGIKDIDSYGSNDQSIFDSLLDNENNNTIINFEDREYLGSFVNKNTELRGCGSSTVLKAIDAYPAITLKRKTASIDWDFYKISDMTINAENALACVQFDPNDAFAGRSIFDNVLFLNGQFGVDKPRGNIGDGYYRCTFRGQQFGWRANSSQNPIMHSGAVVFQQTNFDIIEKACIFVEDAVDGPGAISIRDSLLQGCNGFGAFFDYGDFLPICPPTIDNVWIELVAKNEYTTINSVTYKTRELRFKDTPYAVIKGTYVKSIELINSVVHLTDCRMDDAAGPFVDRYVADNDSLLIVDNLYGNGEVGDIPFVNSIANQKNTAATKNLSVRGPLKRNRIRLSSLSNATNICSNSYAGAGPWIFTGASSVSAVQVSDGVLGDTCAQLTVPNGATLLSLDNGSPTNGKWVVWGIHAKKMSAENFTRARIGQNWTAGKVYLKQNEWVCSYGIKHVNSGSTCRLEFVNNSGADITVRLADFFCVEFNTFREAIEFVNSGLAIRKDI